MTDRERARLHLDAEEQGPGVYIANTWDVTDEVLRLEALLGSIRQEEREACAAIADAKVGSGSWKNNDEDRGWDAACSQIAAAIRGPA